RPVDIAEESVAGEEDPGASLGLPPLGAAPAVKLNEDNDFCRSCAGGGMLNGGPCPDCDGTGRIEPEPAA
ncbi:MAG: hypothetical protein ABIU07_05255, partial [Ramlibacter sp.]